MLFSAVERFIIRPCHKYPLCQIMCVFFPICKIPVINSIANILEYKPF